MRRRIAFAIAVVVVIAVAVELAALPIATRIVRAELDERQVRYDDVAVVAVDRPVVPRLLFGRVRGVEIESSGLRGDAIRTERARLEVPELALPWAPGGPPQDEATLTVEVSESEVEQLLAERASLDLDPVVELTPGIVTVGLDPLPVRIPLEPEVGDGVLRLTPAGDVPAWYERLGLDLTFALPDDLGFELVGLDVREDALIAVLRGDVAAWMAGPSGSTGSAGHVGQDDRDLEASGG